MDSELRTRCEDAAGKISDLCGVSVFVVDAEGVPASGGDGFCASCGFLRCNRVNTYRYGGSEAFRWGGKYIYYCPLGLVFATSPCIDDNSEFSGALISGPMVMGDQSDTLAAIQDAGIRRKAEVLPVFTTHKVDCLSDVVRSCALTASQLRYCPSAVFSEDPDRLLNTIYEARDNVASEQNFYPIEYEKQLHSLIVGHDKGGAQALLNELLGHIYFASNFDLPGIKARVTELLVLMSRALIDAGADMREIFSDNRGYFRDLERMNTPEELNIWLAATIHRFVNYTFDFAQVKHSDVVHKAMDYIRRHYSEKISLDDIAGYVYLSRSYLSKIFKEETGYSITDYVKRVRVEKSKLFLLDNKIKVADIAEICGFEDQSYFTKVFRGETGMSPKKYRDSRGRGGQN